MDILTSQSKHPEREQSPQCTLEVRIKAAILAERVSKLLEHLGHKSANITSGFRTAEANLLANGAKNSAHLTGEAVDIEDPDGQLDIKIASDPSLLVTYDLYAENGYATHGWCHLSIKPTLSGRRIFTP